MNCAVSTFCGTPSSVTRKLEASRVAIASSLRPVTETSTRTTLTPARNVGCWGSVPASRCCAPGVARATTTSATARRKTGGITQVWRSGLTYVGIGNASGPAPGVGGLEGSVEEEPLTESTAERLEVPHLRFGLRTL